MMKVFSLFVGGICGLLVQREKEADSFEINESDEKLFNAVVGESFDTPVEAEETGVAEEVFDGPGSPSKEERGQFIEGIPSPDFWREAPVFSASDEYPDVLSPDQIEIVDEMPPKSGSESDDSEPESPFNDQPIPREPAQGGILYYESVSDSDESSFEEEVIERFPEVPISFQEAEIGMHVLFEGRILNVIFVSEIRIHLVLEFFFNLFSLFFSFKNRFLDPLSGKITDIHAGKVWISLHSLDDTVVEKEKVSQRLRFSERNEKCII